MSRNLQSSLRRRRRQCNPMTEFDSLPPELRTWLRAAALPWSPASAKGVWVKAGGRRDPEAALARLAAVEAATLLKDRVQEV
ncbi:hypothetical protein shim_36800 [Shimia sp. SK013]|uniref:DUF6525 family protein n=1 Tax=Shimia sp. SK013 TaxID=1389006 RepID=UPI0006B6616C|nr:DUF6525 family protein [Shimia sp. SK013]KPA20182.1 hypothetical protein shim_36800 [Shimia sp. SK013]